ncbi:YncE family protein [Candidatus Chromulinivorax destructor]|nr:YncE family protein [Candidatus Chromulinivorax destructor]
MLKTFSKISLMCLALSVAELVYSSADNTVVDQIAMPSETWGIAVTPNGQYVYAANNANNTVSVIQTSDNAITSNITVGASPYGVAVTPDGNFVYVANSGNNTVSVIQTSDNTVVGSPIAVGASPTWIIINDAGTLAYVVNSAAATVSVIDTSNNTVVQTITGTGNTCSCVLSPDGSYLYVINYSGVLTPYAISGDGLTYTAGIALDLSLSLGNTNGGQMVFALDSSKLYVTGYEQNTGVYNIYVVDTTNLDTPSSPGIVNQGSTNPSRPFGIVISSDGTTGYIANLSNNEILIMDVATDTLTGTVNNNSFNLGNPRMVAFVPNSPYLYSTAQSSNISQTYTFITILPPATITGVSQSNVFFTQTDYINTISWTAPESGSTPVSYNVYRDAGLTVLAGTVSANGSLVFYDHNRIPGTTYTYYVTSVDADDAESSAISVSVLTVKNN